MMFEGVIDQFAKQGLRPITEFVEIDDDATMRWHSATDGLQAVQGLAEAIRADLQADQPWNKEDPDGLETLLNDLDERVRRLETAAAQNAQFRLEIG